MADVEAAAFTKPGQKGQKITVQYGSTPATVTTVESEGNTPKAPERRKQTWALSAAYVVGFLVIVIGALLMYEHYVEGSESKVDRVTSFAPAPREHAAHYKGGEMPPAPPATGNIEEDIANGVTNLPFDDPIPSEITFDVKVDTGMVDETGEPVYADADGHLNDDTVIDAEHEHDLEETIPI